MQPISLHPENPRYFLFRERPTVLVTSAEHYGAVLNQAFHYIPYLDELQRCGLNLTRIFSGAYVEAPGAFKIQSNTLAPLPGKFLCPWSRTETPGYAGGGNRFDLTHWDEAYFHRLDDFSFQTAVGAELVRGVPQAFLRVCVVRSRWVGADPLQSVRAIASRGDRGEML